MDFENPDKCKAWLALSNYDYRLHDDLVASENLENMNLDCRCLLKVDGKYNFYRGFVTGYSPEKEKYKFTYKTEEGKAKKLFVPRIYICLDTEDPYRHCERIASAFVNRTYSDNLIKLNCYISNMPKEGLSEISEDQRKQIISNVQHLREYSNAEENFPEVQEEYWRSMNSIILKKHLNESRRDIVPCDLIVLFNNKKKVAREFGLLPVNRDKLTVIEDGKKIVTKSDSFIDCFKNHCELTLRSKKNVILSLQQIKTECDKLLTTELFKIVEGKRDPLRLEQFQTEQNSFIQKTVNRLKNNWVNNIKEIVEANIKKGQVPWFDPSCSPQQYYQSKTFKYFKVVKYIMETTLRDLSTCSFTKFTKHFCSFVPKAVEIKSISEVINYYEDGTIISSLEEKESENNVKQPLFETDLMHAIDESSFNYTANITSFAQMVTGVFCKMLDDLAKIPEIEQKIMLEVFKK